MMVAIINSAMSNMIESGISKRWRLEQSVAACFHMVTRRLFPQRACCNNVVWVRLETGAPLHCLSFRTENVNEIQVCTSLRVANLAKTSVHIFKPVYVEIIVVHF